MSGFLCCTGCFPALNPEGLMHQAFTPPTSSPVITHQGWIRGTSRDQLSWTSAMTLWEEGTKNLWEVASRLLLASGKPSDLQPALSGSQ